MNEFDYIIIGAGASGLLLADAMANDSFFDQKKILLLDKAPKNSNDRTWCFWEKGNGQFEEIIHKKWNSIHFQGEDVAKRTKIDPYSYKMIRGIDFYDHYLKKVKATSNITFVQDTVVGISETEDLVAVKAVNKTYTGKYIFNSLFDYKMATQQTKYPVLQQHFIGWVIKVNKPIFNTEEVTYMDFSIPQKGNTRFMYVLPYSNDTALIEYTLFSEKLLPTPEYEEAIEDYILQRFQCQEYEIIEREFGSIPMTAYDFREHHTNRIRYIGTAGGWAKPSTGYTFMSTANKVPKLIAFIKEGKPLKKLKLKGKFWFYDMLFLDVLHNDNANGHVIFESIFKALPPQKVFKFLDEKTSLIEDLEYINSCPKQPFIKALIKRIF
ncbi:lycopene cyclase family protein [Maribacter dokdonensis]|uniref:lycopene cyclase family protein n=1 Tax=Maribacter dokdonensis TaxID=320912 RepID=UPI0007199AB1|nr:lycopene cyclase family protein [Maribacter dokdonensis]KSA12590.1 Lycopene cyclase [Maribacter dokdonensis DSW-8]